ncbi:MAG: amidohydrolase family protein [Planctomycetota bacterium]
MKTSSFLIAFLASTLLVSSAYTNDQVPGPPQTRPVLIRNGFIHPISTDAIPDGDVLFGEGRIVAVGKQLDAPENALIIDATGKHVYPGLIESYSGLGLSEISAVDESNDRREFGNENPNVRSWVAFNPDSELLPVARAGGVLIANVAPSGRWLRGQSAVLQLEGWTTREMSVAAPSALCVDWESFLPRSEDPKELLKKREEKLAELDARLDQAERYAAAKKQAMALGTHDEFPVDVRLEGYLPVLRGELPMIAEANQQAAIESAVAYAASRDLRLIIYGGFDAASCAELLKAHDVPVIVSAIYRLPRRRHDPFDASFTLPQRLHRAGVRFCIAGEGAGYPGGASNARNLPYHAACAVAYGLPQGVALRSVTLSAAEILGVDDRVGSLSVGKDATLLVATGDILQTESNVTHAFVAGRRVDLTSRHTQLFQKYRQKYQQQR